MFHLIGREKAKHSVKKMCRALGAGTHRWVRSDYYQWAPREPSAWEKRDNELKKVIKKIHEKGHRAYGSPRIHAELRMARGIRCSRKRVARLMRELGIRGARKAVDLVISALNMAVRNRWPVNGLTHHSDHGSQYPSLLYGKSLREAGILGSMGSVGDAYDNAVAEILLNPADQVVGHEGLEDAGGTADGGV